MATFGDIVVDGLVASTIFYTDDLAEANMLKRAIMSEIETYAINQVVFDQNTSARPDEVLAFRLGQLVIDQSNYDPQLTKVRLEVEGPHLVTTDDIPGVPFRYRTPLIPLVSGQGIKCDLIIEKGIARTHCKWRPVSKIKIEPVPQGFLMTIKSNGMMDPRDIFEQGYQKIETAARREPNSIFSIPRMPARLVNS